MEISFFGATREVTGSCMLIKACGYKVLLDCGLKQGSREYEHQNADEFPFDPRELDAVVISHAHIDHSGRTPLLVKRGYTGAIYSHHATVDLCQIMLADSGFLNEREAAWENRKKHKHKAQVEPLYTQAEARVAHGQFRGLEYDDINEILPGIKVVLRDAGHILGSAIVEITITEKGQTRKIVFTGDLGHGGAPILREPSIVESADLVIMESTYGDRLHRPWEETLDELGTVIEGAQANKGNILIPAFTVGRTQDLLQTFKRHFADWNLDRWQFFLDSPMAIDATVVYEKHWRLYDKQSQEISREGSIFKLPNLHISQSMEDSMGINRIRSGAIILAGSGMCTGGRIRHHLKYNISQEKNHIIIVGFQARGTTGRALVDGAKQISLFGKQYTVKANIHTIGGLSAHADQRGLLNWYANFKDRPPVMLVHGEEDAMACLQGELVDRFNTNAKLAEFAECVVL